MPEKATWLTPYLDIWKKEYGGDLAPGQAAKTLAPVRKALGDPEALVRWEWYCRSTPGQYASPSHFASRHEAYAPDAKPAVTNNLGRRPLTMGRVV
jgi:hypothetical protein